MTKEAIVVAVSRSAKHTFSKSPELLVRLVAGLGVEGDAHSGATVKHRSRLLRWKDRPNLRQVHLIHEELLQELAAAGFRVSPGVLGENITTRGLDLLSLPRGTRLHLGADAVVEITGLRNPCKQLDDYQGGLTRAVLDRDANGALVRKAGVMAIVISTGDVRPGDGIAVHLPSQPHEALQIV